MFEKFSRLAEHAATNVSRRHFLGALGRGAMGCAAVVGAFLVGVRGADASRPIQSCGFNSDPECQGRATGDACFNGAGRCRRIRGTAYDCYCWVKGNG